MSGRDGAAEPPGAPATPQPDPGDAREAVAVEFTVLEVEPVPGAGRLVAVALVELDFAGVGFALQVLQRVQVVRGSDGGLSCRAPEWRHPASGRWYPAVIAPPELIAAIADAVLPAAAAVLAPRP